MTSESEGFLSRAEHDQRAQRARLTLEAARLRLQPPRPTGDAGAARWRRMLTVIARLSTKH
jgi:hypothetical protein